MMLTNSNAMCILEMELILNEFSNGTSYKIYYGYPNTYSHAISLIYGSVDLDNHDNITSITFENSNGTFKVGTKVIVKK